MSRRSKSEICRRNWRSDGESAECRMSVLSRFLAWNTAGGARGAAKTVAEAESALARLGGRAQGHYGENPSASGPAPSAFAAGQLRRRDRDCRRGSRCPAPDDRASRRGRAAFADRIAGSCALTPSAHSGPLCRANGMPLRSITSRPFARLSRRMSTCRWSGPRASPPVSQARWRPSCRSRRTFSTEGC